MMDYIDITGIAGEVVEACRVMMSTGLVVGTSGNVSRRCAPESFLITPSGVGYDSLQPNDLVEVDLKTGVCGGIQKPSTETPLRAAIYRARPDVGAIVHTHSPYAAVFAVNRTEIPPLLEEMAQLVGGECEGGSLCLSGAGRVSVGNGGRPSGQSRSTACQPRPGRSREHLRGSAHRLPGGRAVRPGVSVGETVRFASSAGRARGAVVEAGPFIELVNSTLVQIFIEQLNALKCFEGSPD